jgi:hypothetical protein
MSIVSLPPSALIKAHLLSHDEDPLERLAGIVGSLIVGRPPGW